MVGLKELPYYLSSYLHGHKKMKAETLFAEMNKRLNEGNPFVAGKIGGFELWAMRVAEFGYDGEYASAYEKLCNNAGFFANKSDQEQLYFEGKQNLKDRSICHNIEKYSSLMKDAIADVDYLIRWQYPKEEYFIRRYCKKDIKDIDWLGVIYQNMPFGTVLRGRKVLVITPFAEAVEAQYKRRKLIYSEDYLPEFGLATYKAVQTIAGSKDPRFGNWFEALDFMCKEVRELDFDIALVGCGAYSLPLCSAIKRSGKSAVHMGGDVQLLFGIMGKRWEDNPLVQSMKTEYWIYPSKGDVPENADKVEDACYW